MKAAVQGRYGPPEVVRITEVPTPVPTENQLLVKVHATTVNRTDGHIRSGRPLVMRLLYGLTKPRVTILGNEFAGEVAAVGDAVAAFNVGDRVFGYCEGPFGAHAEYLVVPADGCVATIPRGLSYEEAAPGTEGSHYALSMLAKAAVHEGQDVLVYGATGAIGSAAVQLLKSMGVTVTAVCATAHVDLVRGLGADRVVDYTADDFTKDPQRFDLILDAWGELSYFRCTHLFKPSGIYMSTGPGPGWVNAVLPLATPLLRRNRVVFGLPKIDQSTVCYLAGLLESGQFRPVIDRHIPLDQIADAYRYVEAGQKVGNVVINVTTSSSSAGLRPSPGAGRHCAETESPAA